MISKFLEVREKLRQGTNIYNISLRVVYYARVSTDKYEQLHSLSNQKNYYEELIRNNRNWDFVDGYIDEGLTGTSTVKRDQFNGMIRDAKLGLFDLIITKEISRFSRCTLDSIKYTQDLLNEGVGVFFQGDSINTFEPDSELKLTIMSSIAQEEVRKLSERLKFGFKQSIKDGRVLGQDNTIGYHKKDGILSINWQDAILIRRIFDEYVSGEYGLRQIAKNLEKDGFLSSTGKMYTFATLRNILKNPKYKGYYCGGKYHTLDFKTGKKTRLPKEDWTLFQDKNIPAIVSEEIWDLANELLEKRGEKFKDKGNAFQNRYPFSGKIICGEHNTSFHRQVFKSGNEVWNCKMYRLKGKKDGCDSPTIYTSDLENIMGNIFDIEISDKQSLINSLTLIYLKLGITKDYKKEISNKKNLIHLVEQKKDKLLEFSIDGAISKEEFVKRNDKFNDEIKSYHSDIIILNKEFQMETNKEIDYAKPLYELIENNNKLTTILLEKIIVHKTTNRDVINLEIWLKFGKMYTAEFDLDKNEILSLKENDEKAS